MVFFQLLKTNTGFAGHEVRQQASKYWLHPEQDSIPHKEKRKHPDTCELKANTGGCVPQWCVTPSKQAN